MIIKNIRIVCKDNVIEKGYVITKDGYITEIHEGDYKGQDDALDYSGKTLMPGYIDIHVHGSLGIEFMDATPKDLKDISNILYTEGITSYLATTLTADKETLETFAKSVGEAVENCENLAGIHLEGPYINEKYKGAQNAAYIRNPDINEIEELNRLSKGNVKYISLAPEKEGSNEFIEKATKMGVVVSCGHSDATFQQVEEARKYGLTNITHTHNAMSGHHHRNPGVLTAAFYFDDLYCEFICDGVHVCPDVIRTSRKIIGENRFILITDALKVKHSTLKEFDLFGLPCEIINGSAHLKTGPLAGSTLCFDQGVRNYKKFNNASWCELAKVSSTNAAKALHFNDRGEIAVGKLADFVVVDDDLNLINVIKIGTIVK